MVRKIRLTETELYDMICEVVEGVTDKDREYLEAVKSGDMEKAGDLVRRAAEAAMPYTTVVDARRKPKVVLHGTPNHDFYTFDHNRVGSTTDAGWLGAGFYFYGDNPIYASQNAGVGGRVLQVYLNVEEPYVASYGDKSRLADLNDAEASKDFTDELKDNGYDGVFYNDDLNEEWVAFFPNQIKSADPVTYDDNGDVIPLSQRFDMSKDDIRY